jgi:hypothetical protein
MLFVFLLSCNDGDIFVTELSFDDVDVNYCEGSTNLIFFKIKESPYQSISFATAIANSVFLESVSSGDGHTSEITASTPFYFRQYAGDPIALFCSDFPPSTPSISNEFISTSGQITYQTTVVEEDRDNVPDAMEGIDLNGNILAADLDQDGIDNVLDFDDDGDNVPTINEDLDGDGDPTNDDTDGDLIPNYLDSDDDNDGILTRYEDTNNDLDPSNDITFSVPDYLDSSVQVSTVIDTYRDNEIWQDYTTIITANNLNLLDNSGTTQEVIQETFDFGTLINNATEPTLFSVDFD